MENTTTHPHHIVLADDDEDDRYFFREALSQISADITLFTEVDGVRLMNGLLNIVNLPQLIFLDLNMPYKNGKECLVEIKSTDHLKNIPVIIFSTSCHFRDVEETYDGGANLYIQKPSGFAPMVNLLKKVFGLDWKEYTPRPERSKFILKE